MASPSPQSLPWHHRFRTRLFVAIFPILPAVTAASLWIAESLFSGAPESSADDAQRAVRCALAMRQTHNQLNSQSEFSLEVGIATGTVVAGCMGSEKCLNYTVLGHRVNLATRLCGIAAAGQILIDDATQSRLPEGSTIAPLPPARLKGIAEAVQAYSVTELPT